MFTRLLFSGWLDDEYDDVKTWDSWKHFPYYWPFVRGILCLQFNSTISQQLAQNKKVKKTFRITEFCEGNYRWRQKWLVMRINFITLIKASQYKSASLLSKINWMVHDMIDYSMHNSINLWWHIQHRLSNQAQLAVNIIKYALACPRWLTHWGLLMHICAK